MVNKVRDNEMGLITDMKQKIEEIERLVFELKDLGRGMPVVEKNTRSILSFTHILRFSISDLAEM
ncbi:unnamed protein product [marine sediment metagenome]|jgi:hypothetical protein|uniref:Uncharacterized protein n=1 Tax=marine sediment metagenome TaxID=412755 RepID=X0TBA1_9ZZZZ